MEVLGLHQIWMVLPNSKKLWLVSRIILTIVLVVLLLIFFRGVKNSDRKKNPIDSDKISEEIFPS